MQLSVKRYKAESVSRGANLDTLDTPLTSAPWLRRRFAEIRKLDSAAISFVRVPLNELWTARCVLDSGVPGVIFPFPSTPGLARQAVAPSKYPPHGGRGSGAGLATFRWPAPEGCCDFADRNVIVIVIIEQARALENIDAIASTEGIEVLFIGTSDLSFSLGYRGRQDPPRVQEATAEIVKAAQKHKKVRGAPVGGAELMKHYMEQGFRFFQASTELRLMEAGAREFLEPLGKLVAKPKTRSLY